MPVTTSPSSKLGVTLLLDGTLFFLEHGAAIDDEIFVGDVELGDAAANLLADELLHFGGIANPAAGRGHEGAHADIDAEAALHLRGDGSDDAGLLGEGTLQCRPVLRTSDLEARELVVAFGIAAFDCDGNLVAWLDGLAGALEDRERKDAFGFVADVEAGRNRQ